MPLSGLVNYPLHLVGLGGWRTCPLGFVIARLQVKGVTGYNKDVVFLVVPDGSNFGKRVPIMIGTCTLGQVINVIKESEMDQISTPWVTVHLSQLLSRRVVAEGKLEKGTEETNVPEEKEVDAVVEMKSSTHVGPFQMEILEGKLSKAPTHDAHVVVTPLGHTESKRDGGHQLPPGIQVLHVYTTLTADSKQISIVVRNVTDQVIFLKKGAQVAHVVSADLASLDEAPSKQEDVQTAKERMMVRE